MFYYISNNWSSTIHLIHLFGYTDSSFSVSPYMYLFSLKFTLHTRSINWLVSSAFQFHTQKKRTFRNEKTSSRNINHSSGGIVVPLCDACICSLALCLMTRRPFRGTISTLENESVFSRCSHFSSRITTHITIFFSPKIIHGLSMYETSISGSMIL